MNEIPTPPSRVIGEKIVDAKNAFSQLLPEHQKILHGISTEAFGLVIDGLEPSDVLRILKENHPEAVEALDALNKIP
jgi:hypothetical protein